MGECGSAPKLWRMTVDLCYPGESVPAARYQFFGSTREEAEEQVMDQAEHDQALRALVVEEKPYRGMVARVGWKEIKASKVARG